MISLTTASFWKLYNALPEDVQFNAREGYELFMDNSDHPGIRFKKLANTPNWWSVRVGLNYRAVGRRSGDTIEWFWIGSHSDFDKLMG